MTTIWDRIWPAELAALQGNPKAIPMDRGRFPSECENCGGLTVMMVYVISNGPFKSFPSGQKAKWLDLAPDPDDARRPSVPGWYTGELKMVPCPVCQDGRQAQWLERNCGLEGSDLMLTVESFRPLAGKQQALETVRSLLAQNYEPNGFVTMHGDYGTGKSHLLKAIVNGFRAIEVRARYTVLSDLLADIRERFGDEHGAIAVEDAIAQYRGLTVLCIDEVADPDRANLTGWAKETTFRLLDARYNARDQLLTVLASNVHPDHMSAEWGYLRSRMDGGTTVEVGGDDMRPFIPASRPTVYDPAEDGYYTRKEEIPF
jgi:hypothetical protein